MFPVSDQSFHALEHEQREQFVAHVANSLRQEMPEFANALGWDQLCGLVRIEMQRAEHWQIDDEEAIGLMAGIALAFGAEAFDEPDVSSFIANHQGDAAERLTQMLDALDDDA